jgi:hypothetical protein
MTDIFLSDGGSKYPTLKFQNVDETHTGTVLEVKKLEDRDLGTNTVKTWDNGDVRYVFVFTLNTADGISNLWARGNMVKAIREAAQSAGVTSMIGTKLTVKYTGDGEKKSKAFNAPKLYKAKVEPAVKDDSESMW